MKKFLIIFVGTFLSFSAMARVCLKDKTTGIATPGANVTIRNQAIEKSGNIVTVSMLLRFNTDVPANAVVATLPDGFRPTGILHTTLSRDQESSVSTITSPLSVDTDGRIINLGTVRSANNVYMLSFTFIQ